MKRIFRAILFWTLILSACSAGVSFPQVIPASTSAAPTVPPTAAGRVATLMSTAQIEQPTDDEINAVQPYPQDCGYQWAYQDLPELSSSFQQSVQALQAEAKANAYVFGENCIRPDGSIASFHARETDFNITLQVDDLNNETDLGAWIVKVMEIITALPPEQIVGPLPGTVFLIFQSGSGQTAINFSIEQFQNLPASLSEAEIFQALQAPQ